MSVARPALIAVTLAAVVALAGCNEESRMATTAKASAPLPPQLVSLMTEKQMTPQDPILLRVFKEESKAEVWKKRRADGRYALLKTYDICRFSGKLGPKIKEGDKQAPEGFYQVTPAQMNPKSSYYLSFNLGYPNAYDKALGRTGLHVMMHGDCLSAGCYAMTDDQMGEIYAMARESFRGGQAAFQVQAMPFRMTPQNIARRRNDKNMAFWKNLKQGSDAFEVTKLEPKVDACGKKYVFNAKASGFSGLNPNAGCPSYQVEPTIAKAVQAKEKADNIVIAALSRTEPLAPDYIAQNGRQRRTLDQPIVMIAAVAPEAAGAPVAASQNPAGDMQLASVTPAQSVPAKPGAHLKPAPTADVALRTPAPAPAAAPTQVASIKPAQGAKPAAVAGQREIAAEQQPVMASSAPENTGTIAKLKGWMGGLIGAKSEEPAPAAPVTEATPVNDTAPAAAQPKRNRSAGLPPQLAPKAKTSTNPNVTSSYAPVE
ncbi:murein L,D-transpeptidase family protein [Methylopila sp. M107]|uniref:L,D-transpeptidase family protein n=1 Tax=Methylopila sp. M107 TaxID=1101190 RepID=UPI000362DD37|nr:murein L,D-transpeptidase family protein [Methylopila sp. M107]